MKRMELMLTNGTILPEIATILVLRLTLTIGEQLSPLLLCVYSVAIPTLAYTIANKIE